jgi:hypothetical protein
MLVFKNNSLSLETYLVLDFTLLTHLAHKNLINICLTFNHQNIIEIAQGHISLSHIGLYQVLAGPLHGFWRFSYCARTRVIDPCVVCMGSDVLTSSAAVYSDSISS